MTSVPTLERDLAFDGATESIDAAKHRLTRTPRWIRSLGIVLLLFLVLLPFLLLFAPWQQTVRGADGSWRSTRWTGNRRSRRRSRAG